MTFDEYQQEAKRTRGEQCDKAYLAAKLTIEAAEAAQPVIKEHYHGKLLDRNELVDELGDVLWYLAVLAEEYGINLSFVVAYNVMKLRKRHGDTYNAAHYTEAR